MDNLICPEFEGLEFIDGQFLKICQELQFLSFLTRVAVEHKYEIIPFICKIMKEKYHNSPDEMGGSQASFFNLDNLSNNETLFNRIAKFPSTGELLFHSFKNQDVRIHRHADGEHDAGEAG